MSATTATRTARPATPNVFARPPLARLTAVELRKSVDTRTGLWLLVIIALGSVAVAVAQVLTGDGSAGDYASWLSLQGAPVVLLVPVLAILVLTSEWGSRTALTTFALVPRRQRVLTAKLAAVLLLTVAAFTFSAATTALSTALGAAVQDVPADWSLTWWQVVRPLVVLGVSVLVAFALALLLRSAAAAIVVFFAAQNLMPVVFALVAGLRDVAPWVDYNTALLDLSQRESATGEVWLHLATASVVWVLVPAVVGAWRVQRAEIG